MEDSMGTTPHYIWTSHIDEEIKHYSKCLDAGRPFIAISQRSPDYATITYNTIFMYNLRISIEDLRSLENFDKAYQDAIGKMPKTLALVDSFYADYCKIFKLPKDEAIVCGGEGSYSFAVHKDHADSIAEGLFHYLCDRKRDALEEERSAARVRASA